jgi:Cu-Zn family superoxide dismutase
MKLSFLLAGAALVAAGAVSAAPVARAVATLKSAPGGKVEGVVTFSQAPGGVRVNARVTGLTPGDHGFHIHEFGDCAAADFTSAGGHFNPSGDPHAGLDVPARHSGDMGNIVADKDGVGVLDFVDAKLSFDGANSVLGRGLIVHASADDLKTQPTGNAGGRLACGVIGATKGIE